MQAINKSKEQLTSEIKQLRQRIDELEAAEIEHKRVEEALRKSEEKYRTVVEISPDGIAIASRGRHVFVNKRLAKIFGVSSTEELVGKPVMDYIHPDYRKIVMERIEQQAEQGEAVPLIEEKMLQADGTVVYTEVAAAPLEYEGEQAVLAVIRDITDRKLAEEALRESEEKYRSLVESSEDSIYLVDKDCTYLFMNKKHLSRLGMQRSNVIGRTYGEFHSSEEAKDFAQRVKKVLKTGKALSYEYQSQRDNRYFIRTLNPVKSPENSDPSVLTVISKDITRLKQTEEVLRRREQEIGMIADNVPALVSYVDADGRYRFVNRQYEEWFGLPRTEIIGKHCSQVLGKSVFAKIKNRFESALAGHRECFEEALPYALGGTRWVTADYVPDADDQGNVNGFFALVADITERKRAEESLQKEHDAFFSVLQKAPYGVVLFDKAGVTTLINAEFTSITGYTHDDIPTLKAWFRQSYPEKRYRDMAIKTLQKDIGGVFEDKVFQNKFHRAFFRPFKMRCKDQTVKEIEFRPTSLEDGSTIVMIADITERKRMHELLECAAAEWRTTFDAINDAVCLLDLKGRIKRCNNAMRKMIGEPYSKIADRTCWQILHNAADQPKGCPIQKVRNTHCRETEVIFRDNQWYNISVDPLLDDNGNIIGVVHIASDITDRVHAQKDLQNSREQLRNLTAYLESVRERERTNIAREIHDELAQALTALKMDLSWLFNKLPRAKMPLIEKTRSMNKLIDDTIRTVKRISAELRPGILDDLGLVAAIEWQSDEFRDRTGISCRVTVLPSDLSVEKDRSTAIFRIFQETLTNVARHAQATKVTVALKKDAGSLMLKVMDNGAGITEDKVHDSRSFGLIGMRERVHPWGGLVNIKGTPGKGTTVEVKVPLENK
jgi:PAS domain S-box-containing protein